MRARMLGARGKVVQKGIGEPQVFLLTRASWAEPTGSVYSMELLKSTRHYIGILKIIVSIKTYLATGNVELFIV